MMICLWKTEEEVDEVSQEGTSVQEKDTGMQQADGEMK